jgi:hypothetical protein
MKLKTHLHEVPTPRMRGAILPLPNRPSCRGVHLKHRDNFTFTWDPPTTYNICVSTRLWDLPITVSVLVPGYCLRSANYLQYLNLYSATIWDSPTTYNTYVSTRLLSEIRPILTIFMFVPGYYLRSTIYLTISMLVSGYWDSPTTYNFSASAWLQLDSGILSWDQVSNI